MRHPRAFFAAQFLAVTLVLSACASAPGPEVAPPSPPAQSQEDPKASNQTQQFSEACSQWEPSFLEWRELTNTSKKGVSDSSGVKLTLSRASLPRSDAARYNTGVEICPGFLWVLTHAGESRFISLANQTWSKGPKLESSGATENIGARGVESGGEVWGFRGSVSAGEWLFLSDAVIDTNAKCVRVDVHRVEVSDLLAQDNSTSVIYESEPCLDYTSETRARAPIKTHMGGALAYSAELDELYVSLGDFHLGASQISQAVSVGLAATELDYEILLDGDAALSAVVAIGSPSATPVIRVFAKGLRNSLGMTIDGEGAIWVTDHGPGGGDELNEIIEGTNYGWPLTSEGQPYDRGSYPKDSNQLLAPWLDFYQAEVEGAVGPRISWTPAVAPSSLIHYSPSTLAIPEWDGDLIFGTLVGEALIRVTAASDGTVEKSRLAIGERIRDVILTMDGSLALLTDSSLLIRVGQF